MKFYPRWIALLAALLMGGCASFIPDEDFDVTLVSVSSGEVQPWETTLVFTVRLQNAKPTPVTITGAAHKIYLDGTYIGQGLSNEKVTVPRLGDATAQVTVRIKNYTLARKLYDASQNQKISYEVRSSLYSESGGTIRARRDGTLDIKDFQAPAAPASRGIAQ